mmetsp:Transcript_10234/g.12810  ORF Transcript_10234/g.12810 Transcript_10234/m.12810 type:complete len:329 (+) Transcript_10234:3-989(+)
MDSQSFFYSFIDAVDPTSNEIDKDDTPARISTWALGDIFFENLLAIPLTPEKLENTMVAIALDLSRPWELMQSLQKWAAVLERAVASSRSKLSVGDQDALQNRERDYLKSRSGPENQSAGEIERNLGLPIAIIGCKVDAMEAETFEQQQKLQFIQQHLRRFCLKYGAALIYTSARDGTNLDQLHRYLLHRLYPSVFEFQDPGQVQNEDLFIPSGWDSSKLIQDLVQTKTSLDSEAKFETVIPPPDAKSEAKNTHEDDTDTLGGEEDWLSELGKRIDTRGVAASRKPTARAVPKPAGTKQAKPTKKSHQKKDTAQIRDFFEGLLAGGGK